MLAFLKGGGRCNDERVRQITRLFVWRGRFTATRLIQALSTECYAPFWFQDGCLAVFKLYLRCVNIDLTASSRKWSRSVAACLCPFSVMPFLPVADVFDTRPSSSPNPSHPPFDLLHPDAIPKTATPSHTAPQAQTSLTQQPPPPSPPSPSPSTPPSTPTTSSSPRQSPPNSRGEALCWRGGRRGLGCRCGGGRRGSTRKGRDAESQTKQEEA